MAPTVQTQAQREDGHRSSAHRSVPERSGVVCRVKYGNSLPDIPFDPKFITYPFDQHRFVQYKATSLEKQHKHELLTEPDLGVTIDLINPDTYRIDSSILLDPADEKLLEEEIQAPSSSKRSQQHAKVVPWMRKTEYISTEFNRYGVSNEKVEVKIGVSVKQQFTEEEIYKDRDSQIVLPAGVDMMSQAMIRGMMDEEGNQFVAYFLPNEDTMRKRKRDVDEDLEYMPDEVYDYKIAREYNWNVKNKASKGYEENYFFIFRDGDGVYYNELETRVRLSKRRAKVGAPSSTNAVLVCKHRDMNEKELEAQEARKAQLENHEPEDEEEELDMMKDLQDSGEEREKASDSDNSESESEREDEERPAEEDEEEDEESSKRRERKSSGSESGEDRQARDEEEIFGSDDDSEDDEGERARSNSSSVQHSGSERASDSSDASDSE
ncbi:LOW QUALITY PROTEIN: RNA polymerase II-associated factor 1 homolog [Sinocyclocheilus rhinocerous]|uniref:LOW QUALITY PROTEIN: RNA polymerase II-associated factor 1 homolog n=1 Tax=Sinocyclocheilus rhinocerous TaxID=307959 RepID=UPI0007B8EE7E|nr:PREDICTED: LOW QUALITY PROTEIN: RNA polymerase II-associated factor 1 homolog [Sinocyclocheilus rhinocerous]